MKLWGIAWTPPSVSPLVYGLPTPVRPQGDPAETALYVPQCHTAPKCKGRRIAAGQFPSSACLFQITPRPVVRGKWPFIWGSEDLIFLLHHFSSLCFCPFPFSALNSQKCLFFPLTFSPTPAPSPDPKWCRSSCSRAQVNRQALPLWGNVTSAAVSWE